jgi:DNA-binding NarL/FixJ family response regulator
MLSTIDQTAGLRETDGGWSKRMVDSGVPTSSAVVVAGDEETRVLLRGLLRLHHFRVDGEAEGATQCLELIREHRPALLVADVNLAEGSPSSLVAEARRLAPELRVILVAPASRPPAPPTERNLGPDVVLLRPFRIRQFAEALIPPGATPAPPVP